MKQVWKHKNIVDSCFKTNWPTMSLLNSYIDESKVILCQKVSYNQLLTQKDKIALFYKVGCISIPIYI